MSSILTAQDEAAATQLASIAANAAYQAFRDNNPIDGLAEFMSRGEPPPAHGAPIAWVDAMGNVMPVEVGANLMPGIRYLRSLGEVQDAIKASGGLVTVGGMPLSGTLRADALVINPAAESHRIGQHEQTTMAQALGEAARTATPMPRVRDRSVMLRTFDDAGGRAPAA